MRTYWAVSFVWIHLTFEFTVFQASLPITQKGTQDWKKNINSQGEKKKTIHFVHPAHIETSILPSCVKYLCSEMETGIMRFVVIDAFSVLPIVTLTLSSLFLNLSVILFCLYVAMSLSWRQQLSWDFKYPASLCWLVISVLYESCF